MSLEELLKAEEKVIKKHFEIKNKLIESEFKEAEMEADIWIKTDFKSKKLTNADQRKAYVKKEMDKFIKVSDLYKNQLNLCSNILKLIRTKEKAILEKDFKDSINYEYYDQMLETLLKEVRVDD